MAIKDTGIETLSAAIDGLLAARAGDKAKNRERRMRRLIAQAAGRMIGRSHARNAGPEMEVLVKKAAAGDIGIAEAAREA